MGPHEAARLTGGDMVHTWRRQLAMPRLVGAVNAALDRLVRPTVTILGRTASPFRLCGYVGLGVAVAVSQAVVAAHGLPPVTMVWLTLTAVVTFLVLVTVTTLLVGREVIVYYHHQLAVLVTCTTLLWWRDEPVLAHLDAVLLGIGGFLLCGRAGCLLVGCCHGRPARWGARYGRGHANHGFTDGYVGVRLLPVPALECLAVTGIVALGIAQVVGGAPPGRALVWYVLAYGAVRAWLELLRGDDRPHVRGISHGQLLAVVTTAGTSVAVALGALPGPGLAGTGATALTVTVAAAAVGWARWRRAGGDTERLGPRHLAEVAGMLAALATRPPGLHVIGPSSAGVTVSVGTGTGGTGTGAGRVDLHYGLSAVPTPLSRAAARGLARAVLRVRHPDAPAGRLIEGRDVHHLLVRAGPPRAARAARADRSDRSGRGRVEAGAPQVRGPGTPR